MNFKITALTAIVVSSLSFIGTILMKDRKEEVKEEEVIPIIIPEEHYVSGTFYNPVEEQCDSDPLMTADCSKIDLDNFPSNWIAVSRDLLKELGYNYGDQVLIEHSDPSICGVYEIHDTMNSRFNKKIDFLVPPGQRLGEGKWDNIKIKKILKET